MLHYLIEKIDNAIKKET